MNLVQVIQRFPDHEVRMDPSWTICSFGTKVCERHDGL